jgi:hypothetical protein
MLAESSVNCVTAPPIICGTYIAPQDTLDVIGIWGTRMVDIGDGEGIVLSQLIDHD